MSGTNEFFDFDDAAVTDTGRVRSHNEDTFLMLPGAGVWMVADGMGGHDAGDVASRIIADEIGSIGVPVSAQDLRMRVSERLHRAHGRIADLSRSMGNATVGATVAALMIFETGFTCVWAGDSRVYLLRNGRLSRLTRDHSEVQELIDTARITPDEGRRWPRRNVITRAIGIHRDPGMETITGMVRPDDVFLLCSDGLTEHVEDAELTLHLEPDRGRSARDVAAALVAETLHRGALDNVTVVVVHCRPQGSRT